MPNYGAEIICPFFIALYDTKNSYRNVCEGLCPEASTAIGFRQKQAMNEWRHRYCLTFHYKTCPYAKALAKQYEQEEKK